MLTAVTEYTPTRRRAAIHIGLATLLAGCATSAIANAEANPDAELIRTCYRLAEKELENWYREMVSDDNPICDVDWATYEQIGQTAARTPEGWQAKALVHSTWLCSAYSDANENDPNEVFLQSLLRDIVAPARNAILARLAAKYGPLPAEHSAEGIFVGYTYTVEEQAEIEASRFAREAQLRRKRDIHRMTRAELEEAAEAFRLQQLHAESSLLLIAQRLAGDVV